jgi:hypothetical protein
MKIRFIKPAAFLAILAIWAYGCANSDDYGVPEEATECVEPNVTANATVAEIRDMAPTVNTESTPPVLPAQFLPANGTVIEGYVTSSDEGGNFFKSISLQTMPTDGSDPIGFSVALDETTLFGKRFKPGNKVYIVMDSLYYGKVDGSLKIGALFEGSVGRIPTYKYAQSIIPSCTSVDEEQLVRTMSIDEAVSDENLNTLIDLQGVQFVDGNVGQTYYEENDEETIGGATNRFLMDANGDEVIFRTSGFAIFAGGVIPGNSGTIRGVMTRFEDTYQFMVRYESDIMLDQPRIDPTPPIVGDAIVYQGTFTENFESYPTTAPGNRTFPKYINDPATGSRYWQVTSFGGNKYIQMSSFGGSPELNRTLFIVPADMTAANTFQFDTKAGFNNGAPLKVYYSTDYVPGEDINTATLVNITNSFVIDAGPSSGYSTNFQPSGVYNIPATLTGNGYFIFEYNGNGNGGVTTTMQIDNIMVN